MKKLLLSVVIAGVCGTAMAKPVVSDNEAWEEKFPNQYASWATTAEKSEVIDLLADDPNLVVLWAGYGFSKDYNRARGHYYAVVDVTNTLRTANPMGDTDGPMPAACWSCKTPDVARLIAEHGESEFSSKKFGAWGHEMGNAIGCADCHESTTPKLTLSRPFAERALAKVDMPFDKQDHDMKGAQTCAQCHVEYYFDNKDSNNVRFPWEHGFSAEGAEKYYDSINFADWTHKISKAPMIKAQHPEFETWAETAHAEMGVTCVTCHMPKLTNEQGRKFSKHNVGNPMAHFDSTCAECHDSKSDMEKLLKSNKDAINTAKLKAEEIIVRAHFEAGAAWEAGATEAEMKQALTHIRHAQWRWDFAIASHGIHAHNPSEGLRLLASAQEIGLQAQAELKKVLDKHGVKQPVALPDISSKEKAQAVVGWDMNKLRAEKQTFLDERVEKTWPQKDM